MVDKKKPTKKTVKKVKKVSRRLETEKTEPQHQKVSVYTETVKRKKGTRVSKKRSNVPTWVKFIFPFLFFGGSFVFAKFFIYPMLQPAPKAIKQIDECIYDYEFTPKEKELLSISVLIEKPLHAGKTINPCLRKMSDQISFENTRYSKKNADGTLLSVAKMSKEMRQLGKLNKLSNADETPEMQKQREAKLSTYSKNFLADYPRFKIRDVFPENALYFGINLEEEIPYKKFLKNKTCENPVFSFANNKISHLNTFFILNAKRQYGGRVETVNNRFENLIEGNFSLYEYPREPFHRYIPSGNFEMWVHKESLVTYKGYKYQRQWISQEYRFDWDRSPWLYNSCQNSISTISNYCALDPTYDMQYKDFFYLVQSDKILGNIYCKKSHQTKWTKIGIFEFIRKF